MVTSIPSTNTTTVDKFRHGRVPREVRRQQLIDLAQRLFAEHGFSGVSMEQLATEAGITKPVVYEIFGSKDGLYAACVEHLAEQLATVVRTAVTDEPDLQGKIRAGAAAFFRFAADQRSAWKLMAATGGRFAQSLQAIRVRQAALIAGLLADNAKALGADIPARDLEAAAHIINGGSEALALWAADHPDLTPEDLADRLVALVAPGLLGIALQQTHEQDHS